MYELWPMDAETGSYILVLSITCEALAGSPGHPGFPGIISARENM